MELYSAHKTAAGVVGPFFLGCAGGVGLICACSRASVCACVGIIVEERGPERKRQKNGETQRESVGQRRT